MEYPIDRNDDPGSSGVEVWNNDNSSKIFFNCEFIISCNFVKEIYIGQMIIRKRFVGHTKP